ncbi:MAG: cellulase family glycosylhydrolase [Phycisphaerales bacterium]|nr:MAG: cellulase family glycosylhydrolase [Phycisphaerales bacterium]
MNGTQRIFLILMILMPVGASDYSPLHAADRQDDLASFVVVSPRDSRYFELSNGSPYIPIGFNLVGPPREEEFDRLFATMAANRVNYLRVWLGHNQWNVEHRACLQFDPARAATIERFLALAREHGIRVKMCLEYFRDIRGERNRWSDNLIYHKANGGRYESMHEYLFSRTGRDHFKAKLDWYADRYGHEPAVFAWELWNEMDAVRDSEWLDWTKEMLPELKRRWPHNLAIQSLGSYDWERKRDSYRTLCLLADNDVAQVHRYLDEGAGWTICHGPVDVLAAQSVRELIAFEAGKPIILTETGAVKPRHTGCSELYARDPDGTLLHDMLFAPFFSGAAGAGHVWCWRQAIETPNLWYHFARFAEAVKDVDPPTADFQPIMIDHDRLRIYGLSGRTVFIAWCRDSENDWKAELAEGRKPETLSDVEIDVSSLHLPATTTVQAYDPWTDTWQKVRLRDGKITIPALRRSIVVRITKNARTKPGLSS